MPSGSWCSGESVWQCRPEKGETTAQQCQSVGHGGLKAAGLREEGTRARIADAGARAGLQRRAGAADAGAGAGNRYWRECG